MDTLADFVDEFHRLNRLLESGLEMLRDAPVKVAEAEALYRRGKAKAWVNNTEGTAKEREALVDSETADLRYERDVAEGLRRAALESVRSRQTQVSALQSLLRAYEAEASFERTKPQ